MKKLQSTWAPMEGSYNGEAKVAKALEQGKCVTTCCNIKRVKAFSSSSTTGAGSWKARNSSDRVLSQIVSDCGQYGRSL
eukprot:6360120-Amphidinium_carterae.2